MEFEYAMKNKLKILFLEDSPADLELNLRALKRGDFPFEHLCVDAKKDFIDALRNFEPDVIISDHTLPQFNSIEALKIVKESSLKIPFILVTGTVSEEFAVTCLKEGADDYLLKGNLTRLPSALLNAIEKEEAEYEREEALEALQKSEGHLSIILDTVVDGIITINETGTIISYNISAERMFRFPHLNVLGKNIRLLMNISFFTVQDKYFKNNIPEDKFKIVDIGREVTGKRMDGSTFPLELNIGETFEDNAKIYVMSVRDITQRKDSEEKLKAKNQELSTYVYRTSHDLRGPIASMIGLVNIAKKEIQGNSKADKYLGMIERNSKKLDTVLIGLIEATRITDVKSINALVNFNFIVDEVMSSLETMPGFKEVSFSVNIKQTNDFNSDVGLIRSVLYNLLHNASITGIERQGNHL